MPSARFLMRVISPLSASIFSAERIDTSSRSGLAGLTTKSTAPSRMALIAVSIEPLAVSTMMGGMPALACNAFSTAVPSVPGITRSSRTRLIEPFSGPSRTCRAWSPEIAVLASKPNRLTVSSRIRRWAGSSSTMSTRLGM